jgi:hypothetical protein
VPQRRSSRFDRRRAGLLGGLLLLLVVAVIVVVAASSSSSGSGSNSRGPIESIFQDDDHLLYSPTPTVIRTLDTLRGLGVNRLRLTILWGALAPDAISRTPPPHFDATDPGAYGPGVWAPYDRIVELARQRGIGVAFNVTAPGPLWGMAAGAPNLKASTHYIPQAAAFGQFMTALGRRYSGSYVVRGAGTGSGVRLPRVSYWTIWNEANQPGWLYPQWVSSGGQQVMDSPRLYRQLVDAAFSALKATGHSPSADTILIGELAPEGSEATTAKSPIPPIPFIRALYCVDAGYHPLRGAAATALGCPAAGSAGAFAGAHPGLFDATGFAHHPYSFFLAPSAHMSDPNFAPLSDLARLEQALDQSFGAYGNQRKLPIYLTEYGYETNPPNPFRGVPLARQALYLNQAEYMAWQDPRVRAMAQFLLYDSAPDPAYPKGSPGYWSTFQTGLLFLGGLRKPAFAAYRLPIFVPSPSANPAEVWGMLRPGPDGGAEQARIQWRSPGGSTREVASVSTSDPSGFFSTHVGFPGAGSVRIAWKDSAGQMLYSRWAAIGG